MGNGQGRRVSAGAVAVAATAGALRGGGLGGRGGYGARAAEIDERRSALARAAAAVTDTAAEASRGVSVSSSEVDFGTRVSDRRGRCRAKIFLRRSCR